MSDVSETIKKIRTDAGLTQDEFAARIGVTRPAVSLWEIGKSEPSVGNVKTISKEFGIDVMEILISKTRRNPFAMALDSETEKECLTLFRKLSEEKQQVLLSLMRVM